MVNLYTLKRIIKDFIRTPVLCLRNIYINFTILPFSVARFLPLWFTWNITEITVKGNINIHNPKYKCIIIGKGKSPGIQCFKGGFLIDSQGIITFEGTAMISEGTVLRCDKNASIMIGSGFYANSNCYIRSTTLIQIGNDVSFGWGVTLNTSDGHPIWHDAIQVPLDGPIIIGNNCWLTPHVVMIKNTKIADGNIVCQNSIVTNKNDESNVLLGGTPAKILKRNVFWKSTH